MGQEQIFVPAAPALRKSVILPRRISAIRLETREERPAAKARLGAVLQMPPGSLLEVCGEGFNPRTVKVRCAGSYFFVFREDLS